MAAGPRHSPSTTTAPLTGPQQRALYALVSDISNSRGVSLAVAEGLVREFLRESASPRRYEWFQPGAVANLSDRAPVG